MHHFKKNIFTVISLASIIFNTGLAQDIQQLVNQAISSQAKTLKIPAGTYRLSSENKHKALLKIENAKKLSIDASGVTIIGANIAPGVEILNSSEVTLRGIVIDYDPLPFSQGVVEKVDTQAGEIIIKLDKGYPKNLTYTRCSVYDKDTRKIKVGSGPINASKIESIDEERVKVKADPFGMKNLEPGDLFALCNQMASPHAIYVNSCEKVTIEDVTIYSSPVMGLAEMGGAGGNTFKNVKITYGPIPEGASSPRLRSTVADGIHSSSVAKGPIIEDCLIEGMSDDGIAIHGKYDLVLEASGNKIIIGSDKNIKYAPGSTLEIVAPTGELRGYFNLVSIQKIQDSADAKYQEIIKNNVWDSLAKRFQVVYQIETDKPVTASKAADRISNVNTCGNGFIIRKNHIGNHRARGILIKASDGLIEDNLLDGSSRSAIAITPEFTWCESGYSRNLVIRNNTIRGAGYDGYVAHATTSGAISICANEAGAKSSLGAYSPSGGQQNILIEGNTIDQCYGLNLLITSAADITVKNNTFSHTHPIATEIYSKFGVDSGAVIWVTQSDKIKFEGNKLASPGANTKYYLYATDTAKNIEGGESMLSWKPVK